VSDKGAMLDRFLLMEQELDLLEISIGECRIWDYVRMPIFQQIQSKFRPKHASTALRASFISSSLRFVNLIYLCTVSRKHTQALSGVEVLAIGHPRKVKEEGNYYDKYLFGLIDVLEVSHTVGVYDHPFQLKYFHPRREVGVHYLTDLEVKYVLAKYFSTFKLSDSDKKAVSNIKREIQSRFQVVINVEGIIVHAIKVYQAYKKDIAKKIDNSVKMLICVDGYNFTNKVFIEVANNRNIPTVELQHGTIGPNHIGYRFEDSTREVISFPRYLLLWGDFWLKNILLPKHSKSEVVGFPFLERRSKINSREEKSILVLSQWTIGFDLLNVVNDVAKEMMDFTFLFKLHPSESSSITKYQRLISTSNIIIVTEDIDLYLLFRRCRAQVGVYSTALIEGLGFGLETYIVPLDGYEVFDDLIASSLMTVTKSAAELISNLLKHQNYYSNRFDYLWMPNAHENSIKRLKDILNSH